MKHLPTAAYELAVWSPDLTVGHDYLVSDGIAKGRKPYPKDGDLEASWKAFIEKNMPVVQAAIDELNTELLGM